MKLAVFGKSGQLSQALRHLVSNGTHDAVFYDRNDCNLAASPADISRFVAKIPDADVVIIAAAYTGVEQAESDQNTAFAVNARAPAIIAQSCKLRGIPVVYISTDYVFDGTKNTPYGPDHPTNPLNVYGQSKRGGEIAIQECGCDAAIIRTSWLFNGQGRNFMTTMLNMEQSGKRIKVIGDQIGRPTYVGHLADAVLRVSQRLHVNRPDNVEIFHVTNTGDPISWAGFAREIFKKSDTKLKTPIVVDEISTREYDKKVSRPAYSVLDTSIFEKTYRVTLPDWHVGLELALAEWRRSKMGS